jgi:hypothetical protein
MKQTKTDYRNRLHTATMSSLLTVKLHSKNEAEYDPTPAIHYWNQSGPKQRRFNFMEGRLLDRQMGEVKNQPNDHTDEDESEALNEGAEDKMSDCEADWSDYESGSDMEEDEEDILSRKHVLILILISTPIKMKINNNIICL